MFSTIKRAQNNLKKINGNLLGKARVMGLNATLRKTCYAVG